MVSSSHEEACAQQKYRRILPGLSVTRHMTGVDRNGECVCEHPAPSLQKQLRNSLYVKFKVEVPLPKLPLPSELTGIETIMKMTQSTDYGISIR